MLDHPTKDMSGPAVRLHPNDNVVVARIPIEVLVDAPQYPPEGVRPSSMDALQSEDLAARPDLRDRNTAGQALLRLLASGPDAVSAGEAATFSRAKGPIARAFAGD